VIDGRHKSTTPVRSCFVVVPDGLAALPKNGNTAPAVSFVYQAVLDRVVECASQEAQLPEILLAPANNFGGPQFEEQAAARYLANLGIKACAVPVVGERPPYIDTFGNALLLRRYLQSQGRWPQPPVTLFAGFRHAPRALLCFERAGFSVANLDKVMYSVPTGERPVRRLFYYNYPLLHQAYELLAGARDLLFARLPDREK
jgi:uncharacterized SAM-binding protein YcdF (DUF218 family)